MDNPTTVFAAQDEAAHIIRHRMKPARELFQDILRSLAGASRYGDVRWTATHQQHVKVRNGEVDLLTATVDRAVGVRVLVGNGWGFAATGEVTEPAIRRAAKRALEVAAASNIASTRQVFLSDAAAQVVSWS